MTRTVIVDPACLLLPTTDRATGAPDFIAACTLRLLQREHDASFLILTTSSDARFHIPLTTLASEEVPPMGLLREVQEGLPHHPNPMTRDALAPFCIESKLQTTTFDSTKMQYITGEVWFISSDPNQIKRFKHCHQGGHVIELPKPGTILYDTPTLTRLIKTRLDEGKRVSCVWDVDECLFQYQQQAYLNGLTERAPSLLAHLRHVTGLTPSVIELLRQLNDPNIEHQICTARTEVREASTLELLRVKSVIQKIEAQLGRESIFKHCIFTGNGSLNPPPKVEKLFDIIKDISASTRPTVLVVFDDNPIELTAYYGAKDKFLTELGVELIVVPVHSLYSADLQIPKRWPADEQATQIYGAIREQLRALNGGTSPRAGAGAGAGAGGPAAPAAAAPLPTSPAKEAAAPRYHFRPRPGRQSAFFATPSTEAQGVVAAAEKTPAKRRQLRGPHKN